VQLWISLFCDMMQHQGVIGYFRPASSSVKVQDLLILKGKGTTFLRNVRDSIVLWCSVVPQKSRILSLSFVSRTARNVIHVHENHIKISVRIPPYCSTNLHWNAYIVNCTLINTYRIIIITIITFMQRIYNYIPEKSMLLGYIVLQLFCSYNSWHT
jgi:hypothetical protein